MPNFEIVSDFGMTGDQPQAVDKLVEVEDGGISIVVASLSMLPSYLLSG